MLLKDIGRRGVRRCPGLIKSGDWQYTVDTNLVLTLCPKFLNFMKKL